MSAEQVVLIPQCAECLDVWLPDNEDRWRCYVVDDGPRRLAEFADVVMAAIVHAELDAGAQLP